MFWDKLKPAAAEPRPVKVDLNSSGDLVVEWDDGKSSGVPARKLRSDCPCASCVDEFTGKKLVVIDRIPEGVRVASMEPVGNYALKIRWSDGHETGIYSWRQLRTYLMETP